MKNRYKCIVSGEEKYIAPTIAQKKICKFGDEDEFRKHYVAPSAAKLLRQGLSVDEIRQQLGVTGLPAINPHVLTKQKLLRKKRGTRGKETEEKLEFLLSKVSKIPNIKKNIYSLGKKIPSFFKFFNKYRF